VSDDVRHLVGRNIKRLRIAAGLSQAKLAERMGVDRPYVSGLELGHPCNIGVILGQSSGGLADDDLDCPEANEFADKILPATPSIFGRKSKPGSHRVYRVAGNVPTVKFLDPVSGKNDPRNSW
jgi:Helix-turn-helix